MTAATADEVALCTAIRANPDEDVPRLMLADLLDENVQDVMCPKCKGTKSVIEHGRSFYATIASGDGLIESEPNEGVWVARCPTCKGHGTIRDASRPLRAELTRCQVELAKLPEAVRHYHWRGTGGCKRCRRDELRRRESELAARLARDHPGLHPKCPACRPPEYANFASPGGNALCPHCQGAGRVGSWERGLLSVPVPTLAAVWGREMLDPRLGLGPRLDQYTTPYGDWQLTPWARDELLARPWVCEVPVADREPNSYYAPADDKTIWRWDRCEWSDITSSTPHPGYLPPPLHGICGIPHATPAAAKLALARAGARAAFAGAGSRPGVDGYTVN